mmetsp:Transcript_43122/g.138670  ORF Transcript_43122/g.138670 Transcript_43122/m.138670 type:complete len:208 (+) Transcript_43122:1830-2453(+)
MLSRNIAFTISVNIECATFGNSSAPIWVPDDSWVSAIAKTYIMITKRQITKNTDLTADSMPLTNIMSSGSERNIRIILDKRNNLTSRRTAMLPIGFPPFPAPAATRTTVSTHDSITIKRTKIVSNTNQASLKQSRFRLKALKRQNHSKEKKKQKKCSTSWKMGLACRSVGAWFSSVSTAIQIALKEMTKSVMLSKTTFVAIYWNTPF